MKWWQYMIAGAVAVVLLALAFSAGRVTAPERNGEVVRDSTTKIVTVYKDFPKPLKSVSAGMIPIPKYMLYPDSIMVEVPVPVPGKTDTVYLPREQKYYEEEEGQLRIWVSGYDPKIDRYELDHRTTEITRTVKVSVPRRWGIGITAGYGATVVGGKVQGVPYVGVGVSYNLFSW